MSAQAVLGHLLRDPDADLHRRALSAETPRARWSVLAHAIRPWSNTVDRALVGGGLADGVGWAFAAGYQAAQERLIPDLPPDELAAFCVTEDHGGHPRFIRTTIRPRPASAGDSGQAAAGDRWYRLDGQKRFITFGQHADVLLIAASAGEDPSSARNQLRLVRVRARQAGIEIRDMPELPFTPEIPHAELTLADVAVRGSDILPGDGYDRYIKPFRTVEDIHVGAALLGYVFRVAQRYEWPRPAREEILGLIIQLRALGDEEPVAAETHLALAGFFSLLHRLLGAHEPHWGLAGEAERARYQRDIALLSVAERARQQRAASAWQRIAGP
ncbi:MAG: acyl-CoA dehydrogenase family protein [Candidatus Schekmanbacteria bacterium]|nr:acyl-CoA dehydrogenase family protein [Candidatus Schekmanbacteria bacterium]